LKLTEHTVKNYLFRIFDKLGVSSRVEVVLYVFRLRKDLGGASSGNGHQHAGPTLLSPAPKITGKMAPTTVEPVKELRRTRV